MQKTSPILLRIFKEEGTLEVWKANTANRFQLLKSYKICAWSGKLGPKMKEGDRQAPEGFYPLYPHQMNPIRATTWRSIRAIRTHMTRPTAAPAPI